METNKIISLATILNGVEIAMTVIVFIAFKILNTMATNATTQEEFDGYVGIEQILLIVMIAVSLIVIIATAVLMAKNQKRVKGLGLLLASGIVTFVFGVIGLSLGIVVCILCGASLKKIREKQNEDSFEAQLQGEMFGANNAAAPAFDPNYNPNAAAPAFDPNNNQQM